MASTDARPIPRKNVAYRVTFPILDADGDLVTGASSPDSEVSKDGGTFTDCTNEATEIATSSGMYYLDLTSTEMNADCVAIIVKTATSGAKTVPIVLYPEEAGDIRVDVVQISGDATAADNLESYTDGTTPMPVNATQISGDATAADNLEAALDGTGGVTITAAVTGNITGNLSGSVGSVSGAVGSVTGNVGGNVTGSVGSVVGAVGSVTGNVGGNVGGNVSGSVGSVTAGVTVTTNSDKSGYALTSGERNSVADAMLDRDMSTGTDSGSTTVRTVRQALRFLRNKWSISGGTLTVCKEDDTTSSWTSAVTATPGADPITANDPAGP